MKYNEELNVAASAQAFKPLVEEMKMSKQEIIPQPIIHERPLLSNQPVPEKKVTLANITEEEFRSI